MPLEWNGSCLCGVFNYDHFYKSTDEFFFNGIFTKHFRISAKTQQRNVHYSPYRKAYTAQV